MAAVTRRPPNFAEPLQKAGVALDAGLSEEELDAVEHRFGFRFLPAHREFLQLRLPVGRGWPDWRSGDPAELLGRLDWPVEGVLSHVRGINGFWPRTWGQRPNDQAEALAVARRRLESVPKLIPVFSHRYLPAAPAPNSAPVFSVYQTDVVYYGNDLADYLDNEFGITKPWTPRPTAHIPFWSALAEGAESEDL